MKQEDIWDKMHEFGLKQWKLMVGLILAMILINFMTSTYGCTTTIDYITIDNETKTIQIHGNCQDLEDLQTGGARYKDPYYALTYGAPPEEIINKSVKIEISPPPKVEEKDWEKLFYELEQNCTIGMNCPETPKQAPCPDCICECEICPKCKEGISEDELKNWFINECRIKDGAICYQSGSADTCDRGADYWEIDGYPKFKTRPSMGYKVLTHEEEDTFCFKNLGEYFIINRSTRVFNNSNGEWVERKMWGWNDENCKGSSLRVNRL
jgi:hypothetical protein